MCWEYDVLGIRLRSNVRISGVLAANLSSHDRQQIDVHLGAGRAPHTASLFPSEPWYLSQILADNGQPLLTAWRSDRDDEYRLLYAEGTEFLLRQRGTQIWGNWQPAASLELTALYLIGPVLAFALRLQGVTCLHASAVAVDGCAIAMVGGGGVGKSTTAAAFAVAGYGFLSEDISALSRRDGRYWVSPGYPEIRLWPESVKMLFGSEDALPRILPTGEKRKLDLLAGPYRFQAEPLPLERIYVFRDWEAGRTAPSIRRVHPREGIVTLLANTNLTYMLPNDTRASEFDVLTRLVSHVPVCWVTLSADGDDPLTLCATIVDDFRNRHAV